MSAILYTFRRCPYAIRARMAIKISGIQVDMHEVDLRNKPPALLDCSPKGTVPVLRLENGLVIDESLEIMHWALATHDPENWMERRTSLSSAALSLIQQNDHSFKHDLDRYKYANRFPENSPTEHRGKAEMFLHDLNQRLTNQAYLFGPQATVADVAIFPFIRQFSLVDKEWFQINAEKNYANLAEWLQIWCESGLFNSVMQK